MASSKTLGAEQIERLVTMNSGKNNEVTFWEFLAGWIIIFGGALLAIGTFLFFTSPIWIGIIVLIVAIHFIHKFW